MARFNIVTIWPDGYPHSACFNEVAETLLYGLEALGHHVHIVRNFFSQTCWNIVLGAHLLPFQSAVPAKNAIIYNLEQLGSAALFNERALTGFGWWWDYSEKNLAELKLGYWGKHVPIGYVPELTRIRPNVQDIDVLFYGSINERRKKILEDCTNAGLKVCAAFNCYGPERDDLIARSKVVLNVHYYESKIFEIVRCSYLMANRKCIVTEESNELDADLEHGVVPVPYSFLVEMCKCVANDVYLRKNQEEIAFEVMSKRDEREILKSALESVDWEIPDAVQTLD
jgi:hypothetical protein